MIGSRHRGRWIPAVLSGAIALAMLGAAATEWAAGRAPIDISAMPAPAAAGIPDVPAMAQISLDPAKEAAILERPVFSPSRRPPVPPPPPATTAAAAPAATKPSEPLPPTLGFALVGIVRDGSGALAIVKSPDGQPLQTLRAGQALQGWTLTRIGVDRASFRNGTFERELVLDFRKGAAPPAP